MHRSLFVLAALAARRGVRRFVEAAAKDSAAGAAAAARAPTTSGADLTGAGATFPYPLYSKWFDAYATKTGVKINYQSIGSGGGIRQLSEQTVDFGAIGRADVGRRAGEGEGRTGAAHPDRARRGRDDLQPARASARR